jgi:hypothetical protein
MQAKVAKARVVSALSQAGQAAGSLAAEKDRRTVKVSPQAWQWNSYSGISILLMVYPHSSPISVTVKPALA